MAQLLFRFDLDYLCLGSSPTTLQTDRSLEHPQNTARKNATLLFETIRIEGGEIMNLSYHNDRFNRTRKVIFGSGSWIDLGPAIRIPEGIHAGTCKCRITYGPEIRKVEFESYAQRRISSFRLVADDSIHYPFKYADRAHLDRLFAARGGADEIIIVVKGLLTDTSYANIALWDGLRWITPRVPLLRGTCRQRLLDEGELSEGDIRAGSLDRFSRIRLFNAMMDRQLALEKRTIMP